MVWGRQLSDADYGAWKQTGGEFGCGEDVPEFIILMAGGKMGGMRLRDWYIKYNPAALKLYDKQIADFLKKHGSVLGKRRIY